LLRNRLDGIHGRELLATVGKILLASAAMGTVVWSSSHLMASRFGVSQLARLADLAVSLPLGLGVYYGVSRILKIRDLDESIQAIAGPVLRRLRRRTAT
jgi:peptidoglycan biosynthesis protein MviN/MurJ (putative lipid II flippase)